MLIDSTLRPQAVNALTDLILEVGSLEIAKAMIAEDGLLVGDDYLTLTEEEVDGLFHGIEEDVASRD